MKRDLKISSVRKPSVAAERLAQKNNRGQSPTIPTPKARPASAYQFGVSITARQLINQLAIAHKALEADKLLPKRERDPSAFRAERKRGMAIIRQEITRKLKEESKKRKRRKK